MFPLQRAIPTQTCLHPFACSFVGATFRTSKVKKILKRSIGTLERAMLEKSLPNTVWHASSGIMLRMGQNRYLENTWKPTTGIKFSDKQSPQSGTLPIKSQSLQEDSVSEPAVEMLTEDDCPKFRIPEAELRKAMLANRSTGAAYWHYTLYEDSTGRKPVVHYCSSLQTTECIAQLFLGRKVVGFDIEWKPNATPEDGIKKNVSLIQLATEERIALFHVAKYARDGIENLVSPCLKQVMEDPKITKVGVAIKADCTRLAKYMGIQARGMFELSHLYKLIKHSAGNIKLIDKRLVGLAQQVEEHLQLPLFKGEIRSSDWSEKLNYEQIRYAASDSYAGLQLYNLMEWKRNVLIPTPPRPAHAELNLPIRLSNGKTVATYELSEEIILDETTLKDDTKEPVQIDEMAKNFVNMAFEGSESTLPIIASKILDVSTEKPLEIVSADTWIQQWRAGLPPDYKLKAIPAYLKAYFLWHHLDRSVPEAAATLRDPPLQKTTVANYILKALLLEKLPYQVDKLADVLVCLPGSISKTRYQALWELVN